MRYYVRKHNVMTRRRRRKRGGGRERRKGRGRRRNKEEEKEEKEEKKRSEEKKRKRSDVKLRLKTRYALTRIRNARLRIQPERKIVIFGGIGLNTGTSPNAISRFQVSQIPEGFGRSFS